MRVDVEINERGAAAVHHSRPLESNIHVIAAKSNSPADIGQEMGVPEVDAIVTLDQIDNIETVSRAIEQAVGKSHIRSFGDRKSAVSVVRVMLAAVQVDTGEMQFAQGIEAHQRRKYSWYSYRS